MASSLLRLFKTMAAGAILAPPLIAQHAINAPSTYAITNARIVPGAGPEIAKGTIVIRDGVIAAIGASVAVPADARVVDGTGLSIYPGFIDAFGTLGMAAPAAANAAAAGGRGGAGAAAATATARTGPGPLSAYPSGWQPEVRATEELDPAADAFNAAHAAGFTTALSTSLNGYFRGNSALINLDGADVTAMIIKPVVAEHFTFSRGGGAGGFGGGGGGGSGYPGSLMGVFAEFRQMILDAQHYRDLKAAFDKNPRTKRPEYDASLEALLPVINGTEPLVITANTEREIDRALDLGKEFKLNLMIAGGSEAWKVADRLKADNVPVLLSVNFPRLTAAPGADADPEPIRTLRERADAPKGPGVLARAGVRFVFESGANWADYLANVQRAVNNGLSKDQALRAMTMGTAELFGASDRLGTIEVGKIANLTITNGDLFVPATRVTQLYIDGRPVAVAAVAAAAGAGRGNRGGGAGGSSVTGTWTTNVRVDGEDRSVTIALRQEEDRVVGTMQGDLGVADIIGGSVAADGTFEFNTRIRTRDGAEDALFSGSLLDNVISGRISMLGRTGATFSGSRSISNASARSRGASGSRSR